MNESTQAVLERISTVVINRQQYLQPYQRSQYRAARNWLQRYRQRQNADNLEQVKRYLEAFVHLGDVANWESAYRLVMAPVQETGAEELHRQLFVWGYYEQQRKLYQALLYNVSPDIDLVCLNGLGSLCDVSEEYAQAIALHRQALALARTLGSAVAQGTALGSLGNAYLSLGEHERAIAYYQQHLEIAREAAREIAQTTGEKASLGVALGNLGNAYRIVENYDAAHRCLQERLEVAQSLQDLKGEGDGLCNLGSLYWVQGQLSEAKTALERAIDIAEGQGHRLGACRAYGNLGLVYAGSGELAQAVRCFEQSLMLARAIDDREGQRLAILQLGALCQKLNDFERAFRYQKEALGFVVDEVEVASLLLNLGTASREMGRWDEAISFYQELQTVATLMDEGVEERRLLEMMAFYCLAVIYRERGEPKAAFRYCRAALEFSHKSVAPLIDKCLELQSELGMALFQEMEDGL